MNDKIRVNADMIEEALSRVLHLYDFRQALWTALYDGYDRDLIADAERVKVQAVRRFSEVGQSRGVALTVNDGSRFLVSITEVTPR